MRGWEASLWALPGWSHSGDSSDNALTDASTCQPVPAARDLAIENPGKEPFPWGPCDTQSGPVTASLLPTVSPNLWWEARLFHLLPSKVSPSSLPGHTVLHVFLFHEMYHPCLLATDSSTSDPEPPKTGTTIFSGCSAHFQISS